MNQIFKKKFRWKIVLSLKKILLYKHDGFLRTDLTSKSYGFRAFSKYHSIKLTKSDRQCSREQGPMLLD